MRAPASESLLGATPGFKKTNKQGSMPTSVMVINSNNSTFWGSAVCLSTNITGLKLSKCTTNYIFKTYSDLIKVPFTQMIGAPAVTFSSC